MTGSKWAVALLLLFCSAASAAAPELNRALALIEDLQYGKARRELTALLRASRAPGGPSNVGLHRAWILLAAYDPSVKLADEVARYRRLLRLEPGRVELRLALAFARSLSRGYHAPWVVVPEIDDLGQRALSGLWKTVWGLARNSDDPWVLLLAARLSPNKALQARLLEQALRQAPDQLELLSFALETNLQARHWIYRGKLQRLGHRGGARAGAYLLAVYAQLEPVSHARAGLLRQVIELDGPYRDDALLYQLEQEPEELWRRQLTARVEGRVCSAWGVAAWNLFYLLMRQQLWDEASRVARLYERLGADQFGSGHIPIAEEFYQHGRHGEAYKWDARAMRSNARELSGEMLARYARCARRLGRMEEAVEYFALAAERDALGSPFWRTEAILAQAASFPFVVIGNALVMLCILLAGPLSTVLLVSRMGRLGGALWVAGVVALLGVGLELAAPGVQSLFSLVVGAVGTYVVVLAGIHMSRLSALAPGREFRALRKRLCGQRVPLAIYLIRWCLVVGLMLGITGLLYLFFEPRQSPIVQQAARLLPDSPLGILSKPQDRPWQALLLGVSAAFKEEILCRLLYLALLVHLLRDWRWGRAVAVSLVSLVWAVGHAGMVTPELFKLVQVFLLGLLLGWLTLKQGIVSAFLAHAFFNVSLLLLAIRLAA